MQPTRFSVKFFVQGESNFDLDALIPIFHGWIQQHSIEGLLIDVADYKHVHQGPGVLLIGHEADISYDLKGGRPGLLYVRKRDHLDTFSDDLSNAIRIATTAVRLLEGESTLNGVKFDTSSVEIALLDRLNTPNTPETFSRLEVSFQAVGEELFPRGASVESVEADPRKVLTVRLAAAGVGVAG